MPGRAELGEQSPAVFTAEHALAEVAQFPRVLGSLDESLLKCHAPCKMALDLSRNASTIRSANTSAKWRSLNPVSLASKMKARRRFVLKMIVLNSIASGPPVFATQRLMP